MAAEAVDQPEDTWMDVLKSFGLGKVIPIITSNYFSIKYAETMVENQQLYECIKQGFESMNINKCTEITTKQAEQIKESTFWSSFIDNLGRCSPFEDAVDADDVVGTLQKCQAKKEELHPTCNPTAYQKALNAFFLAYLAFACIDLCFTWQRIYNTSNDLANASKKYKEIANELDEIKQENIEPIKQYFEKIRDQNVIDDLSEYDKHQKDIADILGRLRGLQRECQTEIEIAQKNTQTGIVGAIGMLHSSYTSLNLTAVMPQFAVPLYVIAALQATTAVADGVQAAQSYQCGKQFEQLQRKIKTEIANLKEIKKVFRDYRVSPQHLSPKLWDAGQFLQWVKSLGSNYQNIVVIIETEGVNGEDLEDMDDDMLKEWGMKKSLRRRRFLRKIKKLIT